MAAYIKTCNMILSVWRCLEYISCRAGRANAVQISMQGGENRFLPSHFWMASLPMVRLKFGEWKLMNCLLVNTLPRPITFRLITSVDYCSSVLTGVSGALLQRLQSMLNAAAWLVFSVRRSEHTTPLLRELHWLKVPERIHFPTYWTSAACVF